jgi:hypothetical protein
MAETGVIGREVLSREEASANYLLRCVRRRRTGEVHWEIMDRASGVTVASGIGARQEALRIVRGWEQLSQKIEGGLDGHVLVH